ncbi:hypothetical protein BDZ89DRAFT_1045324 [Hymenopellis radicata]|nr:hypothetical protein BDZ89DRAFT_1045324 [Hymenopellis radicata]
MLYISRKTAIVNINPTYRRGTQNHQSTTSDSRTDLIVPMGIVSLLRNTILVDPTHNFYLNPIRPASPSAYSHGVRITHVEITDCLTTMDFRELSRQLPNLVDLECRSIDIDRYQTVAFEALKLESLLILDCRVDGIALSNLVMGSPALNNFYIAGEHDLRGWDIWLRGTPRPRFSPNLRKLYLNLVGRCESYHFLTWALSTPIMPVVRLCVRLAAHNLPVFDVILNDEWYHANAGLFRLNVNDMPSLRRLRVMSHVALLAEVVLNVQRLEPTQPLEQIDILVIIPSENEYLQPLADIDAMYKSGRLPALRMCTVKLFTVGDAVIADSLDIYTSLADRLFANLKADDKLTFLLMPLATFVTEGRGA